MKSGQGFLLVFSITSLSSLAELTELREQIRRIKDDDRVPIVLVGNKSDLEEDRAVSRARAFAVSQQWGNCPYYETSARRRANVDEVFQDVCRQIIRKEMAEEDRPTRQGGGRHGRPSRHGTYPQRSFDDSDINYGHSSTRGPGRHRDHRHRRRKRENCVIL